MAWTTPPTFTNGTVVTETPLNIVRDDLRYLKGLDGVPYIESALELPESATPATPASGRARIYPKSDGRWYTLDDAGSEVEITNPKYSTRARRTTTQSIPSGTITAISFDTTRWNHGTMWVVGSPTRITTPVAGTFVMAGNIQFAANVTGLRFAGIRLNGSTFLTVIQTPVDSGGDCVVPVSTIYELAANDYIELMVRQDSGGALNVSVASAYSPELTLKRIGA